MQPVTVHSKLRTGEFALSPHFQIVLLAKHWVSKIVSNTKCVVSQSISDTIGEYCLYM